ncbi:MAG TPA: DUF2059 domain-containing protein [Allosphingosinicella sp.]|nr:DUF2059 domain-containing protein [Allosphingosinicella sp.]
MKILIAFAVAAAAVPALAQPPAPLAPQPAASPPAPTLVDPARLAVARQTVDYVWPLGTYQRMMSGPMLDGLMQPIFDMKLADLVPPGTKGVDPKDANATLGEMMSKGDPYFQERIRVGSRVLVTELGPVLAKIEPDLRDGLAHAYARRFTVEQLTEMNRFFATPAGQAYASESMLIMIDPDVIRNLIKSGPALAQAMPQIVAKIGEAEKQIPPPPGKPHPAAPAH